MCIVNLPYNEIGSARQVRVFELKSSQIFLKKVKSKQKVLTFKGVKDNGDSQSPLKRSCLKTAWQKPVLGPKTKTSVVTF